MPALLIQDPETLRWDFVLKLDPTPNRCIVEGCRGKAVRGRGRVCSRCSMSRWRRNNPEYATFKILEGNAARRRIPFLLTFPEFKAFIEEHGYMAGKGCRTGSLNIDRDDPRLGYTIRNMRVLTHEENGFKGGTSDRRIMQEQAASFDHEWTDEPTVFHYPHYAASIAEHDIPPENIPF